MATILTGKNETRKSSGEIINGVERLHLPTSDYRDYPAVSQSDLKACYDNPQLYCETHITKVRPKAEPTDAMVWGTECEAYLRHTCLPHIIEIPADVLNKDGHRKGAAWTDWAAEQPAGSRLLKSDEFSEAMDGYVSAHANVVMHPVARALVDEALPEEWQQQFAWYDAEFDLPLKAELDIVRADLECVVDVKTAHDTGHDAFLRKAIELGYDIQAANYLDVMYRLTGRSYSYAWLVIHNRPPFEVEVFEASDDLIAIGQQRLDERKQWFKECRDRGVWLSRTHGLIQTLYPPKWLRSVV